MKLVIGFQNEIVLGGAVKYCTAHPQTEDKTMDIVTYIEISVAIVLAYGIAVVASRWILRRRGDGTADEAAEAEREAFRKWFRFAN